MRSALPHRSDTARVPVRRRHLSAVPDLAAPAGPRRGWAPLVIALLIGAAATFAVQELRISGRDAALATADVRVTGLAELRDGLTAYRDYLNRELAQATRGQIRAEATLRHVAGVPITDGRHVGRLLTVETSGPTTRIVFERVADRWRVLALAPDPIVRVAGRADDGTRLARALRGGPVSGVTIVLARGEVVRLLVP